MRNIITVMKKNESKDEDDNLEGIKELFEEPKDYFPLFTSIKNRIAEFYQKTISFIGENRFFYIQSSIYNLFKFINHHVVAHLRGIVTTIALIAGVAAVVVNPASLIIYAAFQVSALILDTVIAYKRQTDLRKLETNLKYSQYFNEAAEIEKKFCEKNYNFAKLYGYTAKKNNEKSNQKQSSNANFKKRAVKRGFIYMASSILLMSYNISRVLSISGAVFLFFSYMSIGYSQNIGIIRKYYIDKIRDAQDGFPDHLKHTKNPEIIKNLAYQKILSVKTMVIFAEKIKNKDLTETKKNFLLQESMKEAKSELDNHPDFKDIFKPKSMFQNISTALKEYGKSNNPFDTSLTIEDLVERSKSLTDTIIHVDTSKTKASRASKKTSVKKMSPKQANGKSTKMINNAGAIDIDKRLMLGGAESQKKEETKSKDVKSKRVVDLISFEVSDETAQDNVRSMDNFSKVEQSSKSKGK